MDSRFNTRQLHHFSQERPAPTINIYMNRICKYCKNDFSHLSGRQFSNHVRWCPDNVDYDHRLFVEKHKTKTQQREDRARGELTEYTVKCNKCNILFVVIERSKQYPKKKKYFCSSKCAYSRSLSTKWINSRKTPEFRQRQGELSRQRHLDGIYADQYNRIIFSSAGERSVRDYFKEKYPNDEWTSGGCFRIEGEGHVRDLYSNKLKVCIEYDGIWHFKDIKGQLIKKHRKDMMFEKWCLNNNWRLIRIDEDLFKNDPDKWYKILEDAVYGSKELIIKYFTIEHKLMKESIYSPELISMET